MKAKIKIKSKIKIAFRKKIPKFQQQIKNQLKISAICDTVFE